MINLIYTQRKSIKKVEQMEKVVNKNEKFL